jgi:NAD dependent epimerase/dehydratase
MKPASTREQDTSVNSIEHRRQPFRYRGRKVIVTGAEGFIGSHLVEALVADGARVTALCQYNSFDAHGWLDDLPRETVSAITRHRGDVRDAAFMRHVIDDQEVVFHLAALIAIPYSYVAPTSYVETNILGTLNVLEAARAHGVRRVVHTSTSEVYGSALTLPIAECHPLQGQSPYSASKIGADMMAEAFAKSFEMPVVILRPFNTFGPRQSERAIIPTLIRQLLDPACAVLRVGDITTARDFTFVADTASAFMAAGDGAAVEFGSPYNAGTGAMITVADLIDILPTIIGHRKPFVCDPERIRPGMSEVQALQADSSRMFAATGWQPRIDLRDGLERTVTWWRERLASGNVRRDATYMT